MTVTSKFIEGVVALVKGVRDRFDGKIADLESRVAALEARPSVKYCGTHVEGTLYREASLTTRQGSLWVATADSTSTPGTPGSAWRLIVKRGDA
jgi:hypothetical protein